MKHMTEYCINRILDYLFVFLELKIHQNWLIAEIDDKKTSFSLYIPYSILQRGGGVRSGV